MGVRGDRRGGFSSLGGWKEEAWRNRGLGGIRTCDLRDTGAMQAENWSSLAGLFKA